MLLVLIYSPILWASAEFFQAGLATQHPLATAAGLAVLREGGNAVDAAYASTMVLSVVEPFNSGLGGGGFLIFWHAEKRQFIALNFRERAPIDFSAEAYQLGDSLVGWKAAGVPGAVAGLEKARQQWGSLSRQRLLQPAIALAEAGFLVDAELARRIGRRQSDLQRDKELQNLFFPNGKALQAGERLTQKALARTLRGLCRQGADYFYRGKVAQAAVKASRRAGGLFSLADFRTHQATEMAVLHLHYQGHDIHTIDLPSSGGLVLFETLNIWRSLHPERREKWSARNMGLMASSMGMAFEDRARYLGDPRFSTVDRDLFLSPERARQKAQRIHLQKRLRKPQGQPTEGHQTSHLVVVDPAGNAVSLTNSLNTSFGAAVAIPGTGVILNNTMDDFSFPDQASNTYGLSGTQANWPEPKKIPLSSMTPTMVTKDGELKFVLGSPGGPRIISSVLLTLVGLLDFDLPLDQVLTHPRFHHQSLAGPLVLEESTSQAAKGVALQKLGFSVKPEAAWGNVQILMRTETGWIGASDPRGQGTSSGF